MKSLFARVMLASLVAVTVFALVTAVAVGSTINISLDDWTQLREEDIKESIASSLRRLFAEGRPRAAEIAQALEGQLRPGVYVLVFDPRLEPIFVFRPEAEGLLRQGGAGPPEEMPRRRGMPMGRDQFQAPMEELTPIRLGGETVGYFVAGSQGFAADTANRRLLSSLLTAMLAGVGSALVLSAGVSYLFSRRLAAEARELAGGLQALEGGSRSVSFHLAGPVELADIARSADSLQRELDHQESLRRQWAQDVAHDLRTPVAALRAQLEAMADGVLDPTAERLTRALGELARLETLVTDLRTLTQLESPESELSLRRIDLAELVAEAAQRFDLLAERRSMTVHTELAAAVVTVDPNKIDRALSNVISNALQYSPDGAAIHIRLRPEGELVCVEVANPGSVDDSELPKLFDRLYRGEKSRTSAGSGLGLTIAQQIVRRHSGTIAIENAPGPAVRVSVCLPTS